MRLSDYLIPDPEPSPGLEAELGPPETLRHELVVDKATGRIRQAGADTDGPWLRDVFRPAAEASLFVFAQGVMGRDYLTRALHLPICDFVQDPKVKRKLILFPREHCKTSIVSHCLPPHMFIQPEESNVYFPGVAGSETRILLAGETEQRATDNLRVIETAFEQNGKLRGLWPHRVWQSPRAESKKWNDKEMILPRKNEYPDPSIRAVGVGGAITGMHPSVLLKDDLISFEASNSPSVMQTAIQWHVASRALINDPSCLEIIIGCLTADSLVLLEDGTSRPISEMKVGDRVWAANPDGDLAVRAVVAVVPQGWAKTLTVQTSSKTVRATPNHPFLVHRDRTLSWVRADALVRGDYIISIKEIPGRLVHPWMTEDFCWLFGFLMGDGWIGATTKRGWTCIALSKDEGLNSRVLELAEVWFPGAPFYRTPFGYARNDALETARGLRELGLVGTAKTKRLPSWVFMLPPRHRREFLRGFCEADGSRLRSSDDSYAVEIMNQDLLEDLRRLASLCGVRCGVVTTRTRTIQAPNSPRPTIAVGWRASFNFAAVVRHEVYQLAAAIDIDDGLRQERVTSITENVVEESVWDLTVEGTPAFFANGLAVHNTRWAAYDLYRFIQETDASVEVRIRAAIEDGEPIYPEKFTLEMLDRLRKEFGVLFPLLYMNTAIDASLTDFDMGDLRFYRVSGSSLIFDEGEADLVLRSRTGLAVGPTELAPRTLASLFSGSEGEAPGRRGEYLRLKYG